MNKISPETLRRRPWHTFQAESAPSGRLHLFFSLQIVVPVTVILLLLLLKAFWMAGVVAAVATVVVAIRRFSRRGRRVIDRMMAALGSWVAQAVAAILLAPAFFVVMTTVRVVNRLTGSDPLLLRSAEVPTFWLPSDIESRRAGHAKSMFCTERLAGSRLSLVPIAAVMLIFLVAAEVGLRIYGFGTPMLYVQDADVGFYPSPHQRVRAPGRVITINNHSMRSPDLLAQKSPGHVRILLLGDSTLAGTWVSNEELYSTLVEKKLNTLAGSQKFEVLNMGVNAWGPYHELAYVKKFGTFDADVVVICGPVYDAYRPQYSLERVPFTPETHPPKLALEQIFYELVWRYRDHCLGPPPWEIGERADYQCEQGIKTYVALAEFLKQQGVEVLFQMLPTKNETLGIRCEDVTLRIAGDLTQKLAPLGIKMECAGAIFKDAKAPKKLYHDGAHFDRRGHQLYADYFAERLTKNSVRVQKALPASVAAAEK